MVTLSLEQKNGLLVGADMLQLRSNFIFLKEQRRLNVFTLGK